MGSKPVSENLIIESEIKCAQKKRVKLKSEGKESYFSHSSSFNPDQGIVIKLQKYVFASVLSLSCQGVVLQEEELCILRAMQSVPQYLTEGRKKNGKARRKIKNWKVTS